MSRKETESPIHRLRRAKAALLAVSLTLAGVLILMGNAWLGQINLGAWAWIKAVPLGELGGALLSAGLIGSILDYSARRDQERAVTAQFRQVISEQAPALRDAVIKGFRFDTADLRRIATPQLLDELAENSLGLRFGDADFGREVYRDIRHQAISAEERWYDARIDAALGIPRGRSVAPTSFSTSTSDGTIRWCPSIVSVVSSSSPTGLATSSWQLSVGRQASGFTGRRLASTSPAPSCSASTISPSMANRWQFSAMSMRSPSPTSSIWARRLYLRRNR